MLVAIAAAITLHEVAAGLWPSSEKRKPEEVVVAQVVTITQRTPAPTPMPTPQPTPVPTPQPTPQLTPTPMPHYTLAPVVVVRAPAAKATATPTRHLGGAAAAKRIVRPRPQVALAQTVAAAPSLAEGKAAGQQNGGKGTGAGAGVGTGGRNGVSKGAGTSGDGNAGDASTAPCGDVFFEPSHLSYRPDGTVVQQVIAKVIERDGTVVVGVFPWPFLYSAERLNPFAHDEALNGHNGVPVQPPPPGTDLTTLPAAVQVVLKHTDPLTGYTTLPVC